MIEDTCALKGEILGLVFISGIGSRFMIITPINLGHMFRESYFTVKMPSLALRVVHLTYSIFGPFSFFFSIVELYVRLSIHNGSRILEIYNLLNYDLIFKLNYNLLNYDLIKI